MPALVTNPKSAMCLRKADLLQRLNMTTRIRLIRLCRRSISSVKSENEMPRKGQQILSTANQVRDRVNAQMKSDVIGLANDPQFSLSRIPSGSLTIDRVVGGGFPRGRHVECFGDYATGKSLIAYMTMALAQQRGEVCALIDVERVFDEEWFTRLGGNVDDLLIFRPQTAEQTIKVLQLFALSDEDNPGADVIVIDSVASLLPAEERLKDVEEGDDRTASRARMMSRLLRRVTAVNDKTLFLWTNQIIDKVGGYGGSTTPGGRALKFYTSIRVELRMEKKERKPRKTVKHGKVVTADKVVGQWVMVRAEKQKTARPYVESMFYFDYERRMIDPEYELIHLGLEDRLIERKGNTFSYEDSEGVTWSGTDKAFRRLLQEEEGLREELTWAIRQNTRQMSGPEIDEEDDDGATG